jgi:hypothetical protein
MLSAFPHLRTPHLRTPHPCTLALSHPRTLAPPHLPTFVPCTHFGILARVTPSSWLFVKGEQSIWIERPHGHSMVVAGPGPTRERHDFADEDALQNYQMAIADRLASAGWLLWGVNAQRRTGVERRAAARQSPDRRQRLAEASVTSR